MQKLFMIQAYLANMTTEGQAEVQGGDWLIDLGDRRLWVICGDEGFIAEIDGVKVEIETLSQLKGLME